MSLDVCADRVLEAKQHQLDLIDGGGVKVQVQLEFGDGGRHDPPLRWVDEVPKDADDLLDVVGRELQLLAALLTQRFRFKGSQCKCLDVEDSFVVF